MLELPGTMYGVLCENPPQRNQHVDGAPTIIQRWTATESKTAILAADAAHSIACTSMDDALRTLRARYPASSPGCTRVLHCVKPGSAGTIFVYDADIFVATIIPNPVNIGRDCMDESSLRAVAKLAEAHTQIAVTIPQYRQYYWHTNDTEPLLPYNCTVEQVCSGTSAPLILLVRYNPKAAKRELRNIRRRNATRSVRSKTANGAFVCHLRYALHDMCNDITQDMPAMRLYDTLCTWQSLRYGTIAMGRCVDLVERLYGNRAYRSMPAFQKLLEQWRQDPVGSTKRFTKSDAKHMEFCSWLTYESTLQKPKRTFKELTKIYAKTRNVFATPAKFAKKAAALETQCRTKTRTKRSKDSSG